MFTFCTNLEVYVASNMLVFHHRFLAKSQSQSQYNPSYVNSSSSSSSNNNNAYRVLVEKALQLGLRKGRWEDYIKTDLKEID
jgi:hypothetical protein